jgi:DNA-binding transcriptional MerR regulator
MKQEIIKMSKKKFRIGELSKALQVKKFVIRFWEKEFELKADRSDGGQRYYTQDDFKAFNTIKHLLYKQGYTIAGAKTQLTKMIKKDSPEEKNMTREVIAATKVIEKPVPYIPDDFLEKVKILKKQLLEFQKALE